MQHKFSKAVLERCKAEGPHTAIETAANCRWEILETLLEAVDLIMMDIKIMDPEKHKQAIFEFADFKECAKIIAYSQTADHKDPNHPGCK